MFLYFSLSPALMLAAIIPAVILMIKIYKTDKLEPEPPRLLLSLVFLGLISTIIAVILELIGQTILNAFVSNYWLYNVLMYFVVVAISEEFAKYILLKKRTWKNPEFNCQFDGVVYAVFLSLGFALFENIGYVMQNGLSTALVRAFTAIPGHACFGVFMGLFYGLAKRMANSGKEGKAKTFRRFSVIIPALIHGTYDFFASMESTWGTIVFIAFILVLFFISFRMITILERNDQYI